MEATGGSAELVVCDEHLFAKVDTLKLKVLNKEKNTLFEECLCVACLCIATIGAYCK